MSELSVGQLKGLTVNSNLITVPSGHKLAAPGHVVQVQEYRGGAEVATTGPAVEIVGASFTTVSPSSKLYLEFYSSQMSVESASTNPRITFFIDGVDQGLITDHIFYSSSSIAFRPVVTIPTLSSATLTPGVHTISIKGSSYNSGVVRYNYQSTGQTRLIVMEVAQ